MTLVPVAASVPTNAAPAQSAAAQNLFEHMARNIETLPHGASPADLGRALIDDLKGFVERTGKFANRTNEVRDNAAPASFKDAAAEKVRAASAEDQQIARVVEALGTMFDHSIEAQMVVRGTTQVSGAVNTLVKGQ